MNRTIHIPIRGSARIAAAIHLEGGPESVRPGIFARGFQRPWAAGIEYSGGDFGGSSPPIDGERWSDEGEAIIAAGSRIAERLRDHARSAGLSTTRGRIAKAIEDVQRFVVARRTQNPGEQNMVAATKEKPRKRGMGEKSMGVIGPIGPINPMRATAKPTKNDEGKPAWDFDAALAKIDPCPYQPRKDFSDEDLRGLADSIAAQGLLTPLLVRPRLSWRSIPRGDPRLVDRFELVDGERRLRALRLLGRQTAAVRMVNVSDAEVRLIVLASALQHRDLNAIEEAAAFQAAIDAGDAPGPTELARQLGLSQGHVSNRLRLLELPAEVRAKVISREIPPTHARELLPVAKYPSVIKQVLADLKRDDGETGPLDRWQDRIRWALRNCGRDIDRADYNNRVGRTIPPPTLTDEQRAKLDIITIGEGRDASHYAMKLDLWKMIQKEHEKKFLAKAEKKVDGTTKTTKTARDGKPKALTAAQLMALQEEERLKAKERACKLAQGVWALAIDWRRYLIARACREQQVDPGDITRLLIYFAASGDTWKTQADYHQRPKILDKVLSAAGVRMPVRSLDWQKRPDVFAGMVAVADKDVLERTLGFLAELFWSAKDGPVSSIPDADVLTIAGKVAVDLAAAWKKEALGPLTERWLNLRNKEDLKEVAALWRCSGQGACPGKADLVCALLKIARQQKPPAELLKPKKPKG